MTVKDVLAVISGGTKIKLIVDLKDVFIGYMSDITKENFNRLYGYALNREVYRLNTIDNTITIAC